MNYANKDRRKTVEIKFGNLDYFIILLQYITEIRGLPPVPQDEDNIKKKTAQSLRGLSKQPIKKVPNADKKTYIFIKRLSRKLSGQFSKRIGLSPSKSSENGTCFIWNVTTICLYVRKFRNPSLGATLSLVNVTCIPSFAFESILLKLSITLSPFVDTKVREIFGICNSLPKKNEKKCGGKIWIIR